MPSSPISCGMPGPALLARLIGGESWQAKAIRSNNTKQQCRRLARFFRQPSTLAKVVRSPTLRLFTTVAENTNLLTDCHPDEWDATAVLTRLAWYEPRWRRSPETWCPDLSGSREDQWHSLVHHLLAEWPLPRLFESAWLTFGTLHHIERDWYCHAAQGGSLRTAPGMPATVSSRALHLALQCGPEVTIRQAIRLGQLQACGADEALVAEVLASRMIHDFSNDAIWSILMQKMAATRGVPSGTFSMVADTLLDHLKRAEFQRAAALIRLPLGDLFRYSVRWWLSVADSIAASGWDLQKLDIHQPSCRADLSGLACSTWPQLSGIDPSLKIEERDTKGVCWTFHELSSQVHLLVEGRQLRHCVASYRKKCEAGRSVIFSLRRHDHNRPGATPASQFTLEIDRAKRRIVQVRGKWNRFPTELERSLISEWASRQNLTMAA